MLGMATAVLVSRLLCWDCVGVGLGEASIGKAGVVGVETCVYSLSEGA